jgi:hypothetical protein
LICNQVVTALPKKWIADATHVGVASITTKYLARRWGSAIIDQICLIKWRHAFDLGDAP